MLKEKKMQYQVIVITVIMTALLALSELILSSKSVHFFVEKIPGFYFVLGFVASFCIILLGLIMKKMGLKKGEDYYG